MPNYVTVAQLKAYKVNGVVADLTAYTDAEIEARILLAEELVETFTRNKFYSASESKLFNGNGLTQLHFGSRTNLQLLSVSALVELDEEGEIVYTYENEDYDAFAYYLELLQPFESKRIRVGSAIEFGWGWPVGVNNIRVTGSWGASSVPLAIKEAVSLLALESLIRGSAGLVGSGTIRQKWEDYEVVHGATSGTGANPGNSTGYDYVDRLLDPYTYHASMFEVVP